MNDVSKAQEFKAVCVYGSVIKGIIAALLALLISVIIPKMLADMLTEPTSIRSFVALFGVEVDLTSVEDFLTRSDMGGLIGVFNRAWITGILLVPLCFFKGFYRKGNYSRLFFSIIVAVYGVIRYIIIMNYGDLSDLMTLMLTLNGQSVTLNIGMMFTGALIVAIVLRLLKVPKEYGSYKDEREDFIESKRDKERMQIFFE